MGSGHLDDELTQAPRPAEEDLTREILDEAQRRIAARDTARNEAARSPAARDVALRLNRAVYWLSKHWVAVFNVAILAYLAGAVMAPVLMHWDRPGFARVLYAIYAPFCHQYPFRSWFLFGEAAVHPLHEPVPVVEMNRLASFIGDATVGYKMALCQRDIAIYGMMLLAGLAYATVRRRLHIKPLPLWLYFVFGIMPVLLDGGIQWISYVVWQLFPGLLAEPFETIPAMRALTGALFGAGVIAVGYPHLGHYFDETVDTLKEKYGW